MSDGDSSADSFEMLLGSLNNGDEVAAREIFDRFAKPLIVHARHRLSPRVLQKLDPEDVVQSVFKSFFKRQASGQFELESWEALWGLLLQITIRKCHRSTEQHATQKRSVTSEASSLLNRPFRQAREPFSKEPTPSEFAILNETIDWLKAELDPIEWDILTLRLAEHSIPEISRTISRSERSVSRTLHRIKNLLTESMLPDSDNK